MKGIINTIFEGKCYIITEHIEPGVQKFLKIKKWNIAKVTHNG